jgi:hypothetical protein
MPRRPCTIALALMLGASAEGIAQQVPAAMLEGCWERTSASGRKFNENWSSRNGRLIGTAQAVAPDGVRDLEQLRIYLDAATLVYDAHPSGQARQQFRATEVSATRLVFENPEHDFPQRITYERRGDSLAARVEGDRAGRRQPQMFAFARVPCGPQPVSATMLTRIALEEHYAALVAREQASIVARLEWFADHADSGYSYVTWSAPGSEVAGWDVEMLRRVASQLRANISQLNPTDRTFDATVERVLVRGDTAEVMASARQSYRIVDTQGRMGAAGAAHTRAGTQRWIDVWVKRGDTWRLRRTRLIADESSLDGKVTVRDGRPVS